MNESTAASTVNTMCSAQALGGKLGSVSHYPLYVGLDVHKDTIAAAVAYPGRGEPVYL